ncbi:ras GTPase-activating protein-binding protein 1 isoform X2 [Periplaneta americana]|uniref:ras GTPase-activating protein-binding protein 1 isoform X2 n=1 Tax=Periplaneta americana TaxID=6978 RepID=UPI0037E83E16
MVMEAPPSPQCVGREFVRQYYTLLNQAPAHLHRFYNNNSSFVHGGLDAPNRETKPVVGQKQIHQKIQQLNFRDCHAKISQVDSQATLGDGVVVQVTGELSNSGQPMRRFTQTFVLAAQSPKKYYVHNDIFRYQDMIFSDEDVEQDSGRSEAEEDAEPEHSPTTDAIPPSQQLPPQQTMQYYNNANTAANNTAAVVTAGVVAPQQPPQPQPQPQQQQPPQLTATALAPHQQMPPPPVVPAPAVAAAVVNGMAHPEEVISASMPAPVIPSPVTATPNVPQQAAMIPAQTPIQNMAPVPQAQIPLQQAVVPGLPPSAHPSVIKTEEEDVEQDNVAEDENDEETEGNEDTDVATEEEDKTVQQDALEDTHHHSESVSNEPKTYATLVKTGGTGVGIASLGSMSTSPNAPAKPTTSPPPVVPRGLDARDSMQVSGMQGGGPGTMGSGQRGSRGGTRGSSIRGMGIRNDRGGPGRGSFNDDSDGDRRRMGPNIMQQYSDSHQLFMGNLPHHATEDELKDLFGKYGQIVDLRIHSKQNNKGLPGNRVPNYGFIIFEDVNTVQHVLESRPIYFPPEGGQGSQKLNVEEKKTRLRQLDGGRMGSGGDALMGRPSPGGGLGGPRAVPGMMRGGPGMGHHRGGGRGSFSREGRGGGMNRGAYARR